MVHVTWGVIIACGKDEQLTPESDTAFLSLGSKPVLAYSLLAYEQCEEIDGVVVVARKERLEDVVNMVNLFGYRKVKKVTAGASNRRTTVQNGLRVLEDDVTLVSVHEASRPYVPEQLILDTIKAAKRYGSGVAACRPPDPVKEAGKGHKVSVTLDRSKLWLVQTPQAYKRELLHKAIDEAAKKKLDLDDESVAVELSKKPVHLVPAPSTNIRIQSAEDLALATALSTQLPASLAST